MRHDEAEARIDNALRNGLDTLDLSSLRLTELPGRVAELTGLTELYLDDNWLTELPDWLGTLTALAVLDLENNRL
ncbi:MAG TPA: hypothetical protein VH352_03255, partial [Pseudonocardiaceae bacterium]|nr:hypothetical protein [Pseudonocardiaceae bacterium]